MSLLSSFALIPRRVLAAGILIPLVLLCSPLWADVIEEAAGTGLLIRSNPTGAKVLINGIDRGVTDLVLKDLPPGEYQVILQKDGYAERRFQAIIRRNNRLLITLDLEESRGRVFVMVTRALGSPPEETLPLSPALYVDGTRTLDFELSLPIGYRTISVRAFGWREESRTVYIAGNEALTIDFPLSPAAFELTSAGRGRSRFNPRSGGALGRAEAGFLVSAPGKGAISIFDSQGTEIFSRELEPFREASQGFTWDGRNPRGEVFPDGTYLAVIQGESIPYDSSGPVRERLEIPLYIDSSIKIRPLSLSSGIPGLFLAPMTETLPALAFQVEGALLFGRPAGITQAWEAAPFSGGFRGSPFDRLELSAALNITPHLEGNAVSAAGGSARWQFLKPGALRPPVLSAMGLGAGLFYGWAGEGSATSFGLDAGIKAFLPVSFSFDFPGFPGDEKPDLTFQLSPALFWTGDEGYPGEPLPRTLLSGGLLFQYSYVTAGLSLRSEFRFDGESPDDAPGWGGPLILAGEVRAFPPAASFVFTLLGGMWFLGADAGGFGGVGIGLIY